MAGNLQRAIQDAHCRVGGHQGERAIDGFRRNRVIVEIEANIDGLVRAHGLDPVRAEGMARRSQQPRLLIGKGLLDGAAILSWPAPLMRYLIAPQPSLAVALSQRGEAAAGPEGVAHIADGAFHAPFLIAGAHLARLRCKVVMTAQFE